MIRPRKSRAIDYEKAKRITIRQLVDARHLDYLAIKRALAASGTGVEVHRYENSWDRRIIYATDSAESMPQRSCGRLLLWLPANWVWPGSITLCVTVAGEPDELNRVYYVDVTMQNGNVTAAEWFDVPF